MRTRERVADAASLDGSRVSVDPGLESTGPHLARRTTRGICGSAAICAGSVFVLSLLVFASIGQAGSPVLNVEKMTFVASRGEATELVIRAERARFQTEEERVFLDRVEAVVEPSDVAGSFRIECDEGELDLTTNDFEARGNVRGHTDGGREFTADWVRYDHAAGLLFTNAPVLICEDEISYRGGGFQYLVRERRFRLLGGAVMDQQASSCMGKQ